MNNYLKGDSSRREREAFFHGSRFRLDPNGKIISGLARRVVSRSSNCDIQVRPGVVAVVDVFFFSFSFFLWFFFDFSREAR